MSSVYRRSSYGTNFSKTDTRVNLSSLSRKSLSDLDMSNLETSTSKNLAFISFNYVQVIDETLTKEESEDRINLLLITVCVILSTFLIQFITIIFSIFADDQILIFPYIPKLSGKIIESFVTITEFENFGC